jgi:hypothetical protein
VELRKGNGLPCHAAVGIAYRIVNTGDHAITALRVAFWAFDADGAPLPAAGRNYVQATASITIEPGAELEICTSLDDVFYCVPEGEVQITNFEITEVELADGSTWSDPLCRFRYQNPIPNVEVPDEGTPPSSASRATARSASPAPHRPVRLVM